MLWGLFVREATLFMGVVYCGEFCVCRGWRAFAHVAPECELFLVLVGVVVVAFAWSAWVVCVLLGCGCFVLALVFGSFLFGRFGCFQVCFFEVRAGSACSYVFVVTSGFRGLGLVGIFTFIGGDGVGSRKFFLGCLEWGLGVVVLLVPRPFCFLSCRVRLR